MKSPIGYRYAATFAGIRKVAKDHLALIVSDTPAMAAAVFTKNRVVAAPVEIARGPAAQRQSGGRTAAGGSARGARDPAPGIRTAASSDRADGRARAAPQGGGGA